MQSSCSIRLWIWFVELTLLRKIPICIQKCSKVLQIYKIAQFWHIWFLLFNSVISANTHLTRRSLPPFPTNFMSLATLKSLKRLVLIERTLSWLRTISTHPPMITNTSNISHGSRTNSRIGTASPSMIIWKIHKETYQVTTHISGLKL